MVQDVQAALTWVLSHVHEYGGEPSQVRPPATHLATCCVPASWLCLLCCAGCAVPLASWLCSALTYDVLAGT
jgi:hypothetical protein